MVTNERGLVFEGVMSTLLLVSGFLLTFEVLRRTWIDIVIERASFDFARHRALGVSPSESLDLYASWLRRALLPGVASELSSGSHRRLFEKKNGEGVQGTVRIRMPLFWKYQLKDSWHGEGTWHSEFQHTRSCTYPYSSY